MAMQIYGDRVSGNCLKVKWTADKLGLAYVWIQTDVLQAQSRTPQFLALNPAGQVPTVVLEDGRPLAQSNAIILHLAQGSDLIPADAYDRARMLEWMFWEQYSHEPYIAVARFQRLLLGRPADQIEPRLMERGHAALARMAGSPGRRARAAAWRARKPAAPVSSVWLTPPPPGSRRSRSFPVRARVPDRRSG